MDQSQNDCLRYQGWPVQRHDNVGVGMREEVAKLGWILSMEYAEVDVIPLLRLDGRGPLRLGRSLRYSGRMRCLRSSDVEPRLLLLLQGGSTLRWLLLGNGGTGGGRRLIRVRRIS